METQTICRAALYLRLSRDDGEAESASIATQRKLLVNYAAQNGYTIYGEYIDDGWSGTNFDRPAFRRMLADIEDRKVNLVITKDLSRLGRDYIKVGQYTELYFPSKGVRYIAVNDGYDSESPYQDIAPFKNVMNEMYARDISQKIRSALIAQMKDGAYIGAFAPYGYQKDTADKNHLIADAQTCEIVKAIFHMAANGMLPAGIAQTLNGQGVPSPAVYRCMTHCGLDVNAYSKRQEWTGATIAKMLRNVVYLGHTAQGKTTKLSFRSGLTVKKPPDEWILVRNTHTALVDEEVFSLIQRRIRARTCKKKGEFTNIFSGIVKCADCGRNMSATGTRKKGSPANLICGGYKLYGARECSNHFIDYNALYEIVQKALQDQLSVCDEERETILDLAEDHIGKDAARMDLRQTLSEINKRRKELDGIVKRLYEDNAAGRLGEGRMNQLLLRFEQEAKALDERERYLLRRRNEAETPVDSTRERLNMLMNGIIHAEKLSKLMLFQLIDHIEVGQGQYEKDECGSVKRQTIRIAFRFQAKTGVTEFVR